MCFGQNGAVFIVHCVMSSVCYPLPLGFDEFHRCCALTFNIIIIERSVTRWIQFFDDDRVDVGVTKRCPMIEIRNLRHFQKFCYAKFKQGDRSFFENNSGQQKQLMCDHCVAGY